MCFYVCLYMYVHVCMYVCINMLTYDQIICQSYSFVTLKFPYRDMYKYILFTQTKVCFDSQDDPHQQSKLVNRPNEVLDPCLSLLDIEQYCCFVVFNVY